MSGEREPWSAWSGWLYPLAGATLYALDSTYSTLVLAAALALLGVGTFAFHWWPDSDTTQSLDHAGMNATYAVLATAAVGGNLVALLVAASLALAAELVWDRPNRALMGALVFLTLVATWSPLSVAGFSLLGVGFAVWQIRDPLSLGPIRLTPDTGHALWHLLTAAGTALLYLGGTP